MRKFILASALAFATSITPAAAQNAEKALHFCLQARSLAGNFMVLRQRGTPKEKLVDAINSDEGTDESGRQFAMGLLDRAYEVPQTARSGEDIDRISKTFADKVTKECSEKYIK